MFGDKMVSKSLKHEVILSSTFHSYISCFEAGCRNPNTDGKEVINSLNFCGDYVPLIGREMTNV